MVQFVRCSSRPEVKLLPGPSASGFSKSVTPVSPPVPVIAKPDSKRCTCLLGRWSLQGTGIRRLLLPFLPLRALLLRLRLHLHLPPLWLLLDLDLLPQLPLLLLDPVVLLSLLDQRVPRVPLRPLVQI